MKTRKSNTITAPAGLAAATNSDLVRRGLRAIALLLAAAAMMVTSMGWAQQKPGAAGKLDRTVLPIPEPSYPPITELDARKAKAPPRFQVKAPAGAPTW